MTGPVTSILDSPPRQHFAGECFRLHSIIANSYDKFVHSLHDMVSTIERFLLNPKNKSKDFRPFFRHNKPDITKIRTTKNRYLKCLLFM